MERYQRGKGKRRLLGSHQKCWLWGRNLVLEILRAGRWPMRALYVAEGLPAAELAAARLLAAQQGVTPCVEPPSRLRDLCHSAEHQGYAVQMEEFPYTAAEAVLSLARATSPLYVLLDGVQDPYNFGAILRSAEVLGVDAVFISAKGGVGVTSMVARSSAGAVNRVPIVRVEALAELAAHLKSAGVALVGASEKAQDLLERTELRGPVAIVIGNEGCGIQPELARLCDRLAKIPQYGKIGSLNVAVAASIFFYEARRQRRG